MLPIAKHRDAILKSVADNQVTIIVGETGSGKTTAVPQYLYEAGFGKSGMIGVTEPRRIAAISVAKFVASNLNVTVGKTVAHKIRFDDTTDADTVVKFMTDGILLREFHDDPLLSRYAVIMVDEAHERSANIDFLLGLLKQVLAKRPELRLVVASATIDADKFSNYFGGAPVLTIDGRLHNVEIVWGQTYTASTCEGVVPTIQKILETNRDGDILVFLTGVDDIRAIEEKMGYLRGSHDLVVLPAHGGLAPEDQAKVFYSYPGRRKVVLATNIAETSITIDGVVFVIDTGFIKQTHFVPSIGIQSLDVCEHSRAGCEQRAGRAGRTRPGVCYRLYTKEDYDSRPAFTEPEIKRMSLAGVVLAMEALEIPNIKDFDFIDPPDAQAFKEAYETLEALGAIEKDKPGLTKVGAEMAALPLEPRVSRMVIEAKKYGCVEDIVVIAAFMSLGGRNVFVRPNNGKAEGDAALVHARFKSRTSDMLTFINVWRAYVDNGCSNGWCRGNFLVGKALQEVRNIVDQLLDHLERAVVNIAWTEDNDAILRCVAAGLSHNLLRHGSRYEYQGVERDELWGVYIHPGSSVFGLTNPQWMVAAEIVDTSKRYARMCSVVKTEWLPEIAPQSFSLGELMLQDYSAGNDTAMAARQILYKNKYYAAKPVGEMKFEISLDQARGIQEKSIELAKKEGWLLLTIDKIPGTFGLSDTVGRSADGRVHRVSSMSLGLQMGDRYFCKPSDSTILRDYVDPQFRIFNLPDAQPTPYTNGSVTKSKEDAFANISTGPNDGSVGALLAEALRRREEFAGK